MTLIITSIAVVYLACGAQVARAHLRATPPELRLGWPEIAVPLALAVIAWPLLVALLGYPHR